jgi:hypothetical protein
MHYKAKLQNAFFESVLFRGSREDPAYVTEDGFQVIQFKRGEDTDFGIQGLVQIWCGNPTEEDLENTPDDDWGARAFFLVIRPP